MSDASSRILAGVLEARTGQQLTMSRRWRIETALAPLMRERGLRDLDELVTALVAAGDDRLREAVVEALINNETFFFRDRAVFELLLGPALDRLARARAASRSLSIWCAGCSSGQEAYSIAIALAEQRMMSNRPAGGASMRLWTWNRMESRSWRTTRHCWPDSSSNRR